PRHVLVHGCLTVEVQKRSKTLGNVIDPGAVARELAAASGAAFEVCIDAVRYFLLREIPFGEDGDFSRSGLVHRFNADLANDYGNLLNRTVPQLERHFDQQVPARGPEAGQDRVLRQVAIEVASSGERFIDRLDFKSALEEIWRLLGTANKYIDEEAPWQVVRTDRARAGTVLYNTLEAVRIATILLSPWLPTATGRVWEQLGIAASLATQRLDDARQWGGLPAGTRVSSGAPIFPRIETRVAASPGAASTGGGETVSTISIDEFRKLDIRVGEVLAATRVAGTEKLSEVKVDSGGDVRTIVTGLVPLYQPAEMVGKRITVPATPAPRRVPGVACRRPPLPQ